MNYQINFTRYLADDLMAIAAHLNAASPPNPHKFWPLSTDLDLTIKRIRESPSSFQEISAGVYRVPLSSCRLYLYYRVFVRDITVIAILPQPDGPDVTTTYYNWPQSVRDSLKHLTWLPSL